MAATLHKLWMVRRVHVDTQVGTLYQKHEVTRERKLTVEPLSSEHGFGIKCRNAFERARGLLYDSVSRTASAPAGVSKGTPRNYRIGEEIEWHIFYSVWNGDNCKRGAPNE